MRFSKINNIVVQLTDLELFEASNGLKMSIGSFTAFQVGIAQNCIKKHLPTLIDEQIAFDNLISDQEAFDAFKAGLKGKKPLNTHDLDLVKDITDLIPSEIIDNRNETEWDYLAFSKASTVALLAIHALQLADDKGKGCELTMLTSEPLSIAIDTLKELWDNENFQAAFKRKNSNKQEEPKKSE